MRSGSATRRRSAVSGRISNRKAGSRRSPRKRADAAIRCGSSGYFAVPSTVSARCPGEESSRPMRASSSNVPLAARCSRSGRLSSGAGSSDGASSASSAVFTSASASAVSGAAGFVCNMPGPVLTSARMCEFRVVRSNPVSAIPSGPISNRPRVCSTESPQRSLNASCRICRAMSLPRLRSESSESSSPEIWIYSGSNPAVGWCPHTP